MSSDLVSVIVPIFRAEKYLHKSIDSILLQTHKNIEIILVNDGSPDRSGEICNEIALCDNRVKVIHKQNGGIGTAYNAAFELLTGEYVCFVDSDDYIAIDMIEALYSVMISNNADMVHAGINYIDSNGNIIGETNDVDIEIRGSENILNNYFKNKLKPGLGSTLYKRQLFDGFRFLEQNLGVDELTTPQIMSKCDKIVFVKEKYYYCWLVENSVSREEITMLNLNQRLKMFDELRIFSETSFAIVEKYTALKCLSFLISAYRSLQNIDKESKLVFQKIINDSFDKYYHIYIQNIEHVSITAKMYCSIKIFRISPFFYSILDKLLK